MVSQMEETSLENIIGGVGHGDLWEAIFELREFGGAKVRVEWTPSHIWVAGNEGADRLAEEGRLQHPNNSKRQRSEPEWEALGLQPMESQMSSTEGKVQSTLSTGVSHDARSGRS